MILVTGGAGYIGSHTCVELLQSGHAVVVVDNLCNSHEEALRRVERITGRAITFHKVDVRDRDALRRVFGAQPIEAVIHFAGLKAVGESVAQPLRYYDNNVFGTLASFHGAWDWPPTFTQGWQLTDGLSGLRQDAFSLVETAFPDAKNEVCGWKDPRSSLTLPF